MAKQTKKNQKKKKIFKGINLLTGIICLIFLIVIYFLNVIPPLYLSILSIIILILVLIITLLLKSKNWKKKMLGTFFSLFLISITSLGIFYGIHTLSFLNTMEMANINTKTYYIVVLKNSEFNKLKDLKNTKIAYNSDLDGNNEALEKLKKEIKLEAKSSKDLIDDLENKEVSALMVESNELELLEEEHLDFPALIKTIYEFTMKIKIDTELAEEVDITKEPFNVFISGIDTYGKISNVSRSDVNMLVSINPKTHQILFTSIPRDYYVKLHDVDTPYKDKLTHAGIYGIDMSVKTVEDLLATKINYYAKVNFTSLIKIVDKLGGIDIENDKAFIASYNEDGEDVYYEYKVGLIHLDGKSALAYARERKSLALGDLARNKHQQIILEGIINKALSPKIITKYNALLNALEGNFVINIDSKNITNLIKEQIENNYSWTINKNALTGSNDYQYTYSNKQVKAYVMQPDLDSLKEAQEKIEEILK